MSYRLPTSAREFGDWVFGKHPDTDKYTIEVGKNAQLRKELEEAIEKCGAYEKVLDGLDSNVTYMLNRMGGLERDVERLRAGSFKDSNILVVATNGWAERALIDNLNNRLSMLEGQMLPASILNKQYLMRILGISEEFIHKQLGSGA